MASNKKRFFTVTSLASRFLFEDRQRVNLALEALGYQVRGPNSKCRWLDTEKAKPFIEWRGSKTPGDSAKWMVWSEELVPELQEYLQRPTMDHIRSLEKRIQDLESRLPREDDKL